MITTTSGIATPEPTRAQALAKLVCALVSYSIQDSNTSYTQAENLKEKLHIFFVSIGIWGKESQKCLESLIGPTRCPGNFTSLDTPLTITAYHQVFMANLLATRGVWVIIG